MKKPMSEYMIAFIEEELERPVPPEQEKTVRERMGDFNITTDEDTARELWNEHIRPQLDPVIATIEAALDERDRIRGGDLPRN
jgi:hypothetical protein